VSEKLASLNQTKFSGPDGLHTRVLRKCSDLLAEPLYAIMGRLRDTGVAEPLYAIMRRSRATGVVPDAWREANISSILKKRRKQDTGNYRPISLTPIYI
jgi:hypothetical protein